MADILLMEPDLPCGNKLLRVLTGAGHRCTLCTEIAAGLSRLKQGQRTMTILNTSLPWAGSKPFLCALQEKGLPVLFIAASADNAAHLKAMYQADCDVVTHEATTEELLAAVDHLLTSAPSTLTLGNVSLHTDTRVVTVAGREEQLTRQEYALLLQLMQHPDTAVSREALLCDAWGYASAGITRTVDVHIQRLRRKLGGSYIQTVYRTGYRFTPAH